MNIKQFKNKYKDKLVILYYTEYKTADNAEVKEQARQKYLDAVGMHRDFRY